MVKLRISPGSDSILHSRGVVGGPPDVLVCERKGKMENDVSLQRWRRKLKSKTKLTSHWAFSTDRSFWDESSWCDQSV